jgi:putative hydrolase of the HAD superfamily
VLSHESRLVKPDPKIFDLMAKRLGIELGECLFIDDVERYCVAAENLGMKTILYEDTDQTVEQIRVILGS